MLQLILSEREWDMKKYLREYAEYRKINQKS